MSKEIQQQLVDWLGNVAEKGGEIVGTELPKFAAEVVAWHFWSSIFLCVIFAVLCVPPWLLSYLCFSWLPTARTDDEKGGMIVVGVLAALLGCASFFGGIGHNGYEAVKAAVAPRVVLLEYAKEIAK